MPNRQAINLAVVISLSITVDQHSPAWVQEFHHIKEDYLEIIQVHRLTGKVADDQLKILCLSIEVFDVFYQSIISRIKFTSMSTRIALSEIKFTNQLPFTHLEEALSSEQDKSFVSPLHCVKTLWFGSGARIDQTKRIKHTIPPMTQMTRTTSNL